MKVSEEASYDNTGSRLPFAYSAAAEMEEAEEQALVEDEGEQAPLQHRPSSGSHPHGWYGWVVLGLLMGFAVLLVMRPSSSKPPHRDWEAARLWVTAPEHQVPRPPVSRAVEVRARRETQTRVLACPMEGARVLDLGVGWVQTQG